MNRKFLHISLLTLCLIPVAAFADDESVICAAVHPCNSDGTVQAPYDQGACAPKFIKECLSARANTAIASCEGERGSLEKQMRNLKKQMARLKKQVAKKNSKR